MTDAQKLEALIQKAIDGGLHEHTFHSLPISAFRVDIEVGIMGKLISDDGEEIDVATVIFNHDFAKALFGEAMFTQYVDNIQGFPGKDARDEGTIEMYIYEYHLQQAVISDNPIDYMYQAVFGDKD